MNTGSDTRGVEIHDAQLLGVIVSDGTYVLQLDAFILDDVENGHGAGVWQRVDLRLWKAVVKLTGPYEGWIMDGFARANGTTWEDIIPMPFDESGEIVLSMIGTNDLSIEVTAERMVLELVGEPTKREEGWLSDET
ncbi:MAG TPA: hypothetical protein VF407_14460 [Polyangiaceae bacterium]